MNSVRGPPGLEICQRWYRSLFEADGLTSAVSWSQIISSFRTRCLEQRTLDTVLDSYHENVLGWKREEISRRNSTKSWWEEITVLLHEGAIAVDIYTLLHNAVNSPLMPVHCLYMDLADFDANTGSAIITACAQDGVRNFSLLASGVHNPGTKIESIMTNLTEMSSRERITHKIQVTVWLDIHHPSAESVISSDALAKFLSRENCRSISPLLSLGVLVPNANTMREFFSDKTKPYISVQPNTGIHRKYGEAFHEAYQQEISKTGPQTSNNPGEILERLILLSLGRGCETYLVPRDALCAASPNIPFLPQITSQINSLYPEIPSTTTTNDVSIDFPPDREVYIGGLVGDRVALPDHTGACPQLLQRGKITITNSAHVIMAHQVTKDQHEFSLMKQRFAAAAIVAATISAGLVEKVKHVVDSCVTHSIPVVNDIVIGIQGHHTATKDSSIHFPIKLGRLLANIAPGLRPYVNPIPCLSLSMLFNISNGLVTNIVPHRYYPCSKTMLPVLSVDHAFEEWTTTLGKKYAASDQLEEYYKYLLETAGQGGNTLLQYQMKERGDIERAFGKPYGGKLFVRYEDIELQVARLGKTKKKVISTAITEKDGKCLSTLREQIVAAAIRIELIETIERTFCLLPDLVAHNCAIVDKAVSNSIKEGDAPVKQFLCMKRRPRGSARNYFKGLFTNPKTRRIFLQTFKFLWDGFVIVASMAHIPMFPDIDGVEKIIDLFTKPKIPLTN
jgi:hypothetical protein